MKVVNLFFFLLGLICSAEATDNAKVGQSIRSTVGLTDRRTAYERSVDMLQHGMDTIKAIRLMETWLEAVPTDTNAANILARAYECKGMHQEALLARSIKPAVVRVDDERIQTVYTPQVRVGTYKVLLPKNYSPAKKYPAVLLLHGNGQNPDVMLDWARTLNMDSVIFISPYAPYTRMQETMQTQRHRYSASGDGIDLPDSVMYDVVDESSSWYRDSFLDASAKFSIAKVKPIIVGFSQGGFYSYVVASRFPGTFQSVVSISASMYQYGRMEDFVNNLRTYGIDALVLHGTKDNVVPLQTAELIVSMLVNAGVAAELVKFDGEHWPTPEATQSIRAWLTKRLH